MEEKPTFCQLAGAGKHYGDREALLEVADRQAFDRGRGQLQLAERFSGIALAIDGDLCS